MTTPEKPEIKRPSCYNRAPWKEQVVSGHGHSYPFRMSMACPQWSGDQANAHVTPHCDSAGGVKTPWSSCTDCKWK